MKTWSIQTINTRWFKIIFSSPSWRSLNLWKGHDSPSQKGHLESPGKQANLPPLAESQSRLRWVDVELIPFETSNANQTGTRHLLRWTKEMQEGWSTWMMDLLSLVDWSYLCWLESSNENALGCRWLWWKVGKPSIWHSLNHAGRKCNFWSHDVCCSISAP